MTLSRKIPRRKRPGRRNEDRGPGGAKRKTAPAVRACLVILACNAVLVGLKGLGGILGGSKALQADAANSLGDVFTSFLVLTSLLVASRPRDAEHPYGHGRAEDIAANIMGVALSFFGIYLFVRSLTAMITSSVLTPEFLTVGVAAANLVAKEAMYRFASSHGKILRSPALEAIAVDFRSDVLVSAAILAGLLGAVLRWPLLDPLVSLPVAGAVVYMGTKICRTSIHALMDGMPEEETLDRATRAAEGVPGVGKVKDIRGRFSGGWIFLDMKIEVDPELTVDEGHDIAHEVEETLLREIPEVKGVHIHVNPAPHSHLDPPPRARPR